MLSVLTNVSQPAIDRGQLEMNKSLCYWSRGRSLELATCWGVTEIKFNPCCKVRVGCAMRAIQLWAQSRPFIESARGSRRIWFGLTELSSNESASKRDSPLFFSNGSGPERRIKGSKLGWMTIKAAISGKYVMMPRSKRTPSVLSEVPGAHFCTG